jgi:hypothetical protein
MNSSARLAEAAVSSAALAAPATAADARPGPEGHHTTTDPHATTPGPDSRTLGARSGTPSSRPRLSLVGPRTTSRGAEPDLGPRTAPGPSPHGAGRVFSVAPPWQ